MIIYIAGPYRGASESEVWANIMRARDCAAEVWKRGHVAICPHLNTMLMGGILPDERWLSGDLEILRRCDAVCLYSLRHSSGTDQEIAVAKELGLPIYHGVSEIPGVVE